MPAVVYVLCGSDRLAKLNRVRELKRALAVELVDQHHVSGDALKALVPGGLWREPPLAGRLRLIVIEDAQQLDDACAALVVERATQPSLSVCVILLFEEELEKRSPWAGLGPQVVVERFAAEGRDTPSGFELVNAIARRDVLAALTGLQEQVASGKELLDVVGLLGWQLQRWLVVKRGGDAGLQPWQLERVRGEVASRSVESLQRSVRRLWDVDVAAKQGRLPSTRLAVEGVAVELCRA